MRRLRTHGNWVPVLLAPIRALLRRGARARPVVISAGDLKLDPASREVWVKDMRPT